MTDGAVLLVWTGRLLLSYVAHCVNAGMEHLPASHEKKGERANNPHLPAQKVHNRIFRRRVGSCQLR